MLERNYPDIESFKQSVNLYVYCMSNPIKYIDSTGRDAAVIGCSIGAVAGIPGVVIGTIVGTAITVGVVHMAVEHTKLNGSKKELMISIQNQDRSVQQKRKNKRKHGKKGNKKYDL